MKRIAILVVAIFGLCTNPHQAAAQEKKMMWNLGFLAAPKTVYQEVAEELPARFSKLTNGQVEIHPTSSLIPPTEHLAAVKDGRLEAALMVNAYFSGEAPLLNIGGLPGLFSNFDEYRAASQSVLNQRFAKLVEERYNAVYLFSGVWSGQVIWGRQAIRTAADFSGKKLRAHNSEVAQLMSQLGAKPIAMPLGEFLPALQRGVVDGGITGSMTGVGLGYAQFAKYVNDWRLGYATAFGLVVNKAVWNKLSESSRNAIIADLKNYETEVFKRVEVETDQGIKKAVEMGATHVKPADSEMAKLRDLRHVQGIYDNWNALNKKQGIEDSAEVLQAVQKVLKR